MAGNPHGFATEGTAREVLGAIAALANGNAVPEGDEQVTVQPYTRQDGTTARVVETITTTAGTRTVTTDYEPPLPLPEVS